MAEHKPVAVFAEFIDTLRDDVDKLSNAPGGSQIVKGRVDLKKSGRVRFPNSFPSGAPTVVVTTSSYDFDKNHADAFKICEPRICIGRVTGDYFDYECKGELASTNASGWSYSNLLYYLAMD